VAALAVALSGALQGILELGSWAAVLATTYGQLVVLKVGLLLAMLVMAGLTEWRVRSSSSGVLGLGRGVRVELALGLVVLAVAAMLSGTPPSAGG
jgi:putative copper export protein